MTIWSGSAVLPMHKAERSILESMMTVMLQVLPTPKNCSKISQTRFVMQWVLLWMLICYQKMEMNISRLQFPLTRWLFPVKEFITIAAAAPYRPCPVPSSNALSSESEVQHGIICRLLLLPLTTLTASLLNDLKNLRSKKEGSIKAFLMSLPMF